MGGDVNGNLTAASETFATSKNRSFVADAAGHILQKTENGKTQNYFYANGKPLGSSGALGAADFDFNYTPVSAQYPASTPGSYVVSAGDTLRGIALAVFGDAQLWYLTAGRFRRRLVACSRRTWRRWWCNSWCRWCRYRWRPGSS